MTTSLGKADWREAQVGLGFKPWSLQSWTHISGEMINKDEHLMSAFLDGDTLFIEA